MHNDDALLDLWSLDELPACEAGMKLLKVVYDSEEQPVFWNTLRLYAGGVSRTSELRNPAAWEAYTKHYGSCDCCNEV
jgi:hypothetical protein